MGSLMERKSAARFADKQLRWAVKVIQEVIYGFEHDTEAPCARVK